VSGRAAPERLVPPPEASGVGGGEGSGRRPLDTQDETCCRGGERAGQGVDSDEARPGPGGGGGGPSGALPQPTGALMGPARRATVWRALAGPGGHVGRWGGLGGLPPGALVGPPGPARRDLASGWGSTHPTPSPRTRRLSDSRAARLEREKAAGYGGGWVVNLGRVVRRPGLAPRPGLVPATPVGERRRGQRRRGQAPTDS
jgi:hypothetical protein